LTNVLSVTVIAWFVVLMVKWAITPGMNLPLPISRRALAVILAAATILGAIATLEEALAKPEPRLGQPPSLLLPDFSIPSFRPPPCVPLADLTCSAAP